MHEKLKLGDMEVIRPDEKLVEITKTVLEQNKMVLEMNAQLLRDINSSILICKNMDDCVEPKDLGVEDLTPEER